MEGKTLPGVKALQDEDDEEFTQEEFDM
jgi:hypothetical protein